MVRALMSGVETPWGILSKFCCSFWFNFTRLLSMFSPTLNRTMTVDWPSLEVE